MILAISTLRNLEVHQMGVKTTFLNGEINEEIYMEQPEGHVVLGQERKSHYVDKIFGKFSKDDSGIARTPIDMSQHLSKNKGESANQVEYARVIGSLMYLMSCTRPDITFTILLFEKDSLMPIGYLIFNIPKAQVDMFLHWEEELCYGNPQGKRL
ncbi:Zinc finger, CCHC-type [Gossypium australe]|uniref:Zinc finger, CCHC-type n=1 Tax=Gossypium australe TaxID=47621 RepID=A0A5B6W8E7_9ROSI|nr:Zinc finger, CCHC-type [Gossypium australe]